MKFCNNCRNPMDDNAIFCSCCGARANGDGPSVNYNPYGGFNDPYGYDNPYGYYRDYQGSKAIAVLSFIYWPAGLIMWFFWRHARPGKARSASKGALASGSLSMPILGLILWLVWREDYEKKDYAKACGISAIVGAAIYAVAIIAQYVLGLSGVLDPGSYDMIIPFGDTAAAVIGSFLA